MGINVLDVGGKADAKCVAGIGADGVSDTNADRLVNNDTGGNTDIDFDTDTVAIFSSDSDTNIASEIKAGAVIESDPCTEADFDNVPEVNGDFSLDVDPDTDVGCDIDNDPELVRDNCTESDTNVDFSTNSYEEIVCANVGSVTDTAGGTELDADCDNDASDEVVWDTDNEATADTDDIGGTETDELGEDDADRLSGQRVGGIIICAVGDAAADGVTGTATDGDNETDADGAGDIDCEADRFTGFASDRDTNGTSDVDAGTVIDEDVAENNSGVDPDANDDRIGTNIDDTEMEGVIDVKSNDAIDNGNFDFDAINDEDGDTGTNTDCSTMVDDVG